MSPLPSVSFLEWRHGCEVESCDSLTAVKERLRTHRDAGCQATEAQAAATHCLASGNTTKINQRWLSHLNCYFVTCSRKHFFFFFFLRFCLFLERGEGREKEGERNIDVWLPLVHPQLEIRHTTQACALTGNRTSDPLVCRSALNPLSHTSQSNTFLIDTLIDKFNCVQYFCHKNVCYKHFYQKYFHHKYFHCTTNWPYGNLATKDKIMKNKGGGIKKHT